MVYRVELRCVFLSYGRMVVAFAQIKRLKFHRIRVVPKHRLELVHFGETVNFMNFLRTLLFYEYLRTLRRLSGITVRCWRHMVYSLVLFLERAARLLEDVPPTAHAPRLNIILRKRYFALSRL
jgi:hypothetical protein